MFAIDVSSNEVFFFFLQYEKNRNAARMTAITGILKFSEKFHEGEGVCTVIKVISDEFAGEYRCSK